ncbi:MAG: NAD-binding protein [Bacilli bacterium]|nr:NAD-binding protein [Bacilli bacterium]
MAKPAKKKMNRGHLHLIIGASRLGSRIAIKHAKEGKYVTVIDKDKKAANKLGEDFLGSFVCGDATKISTLLEANVKSAQEVVIVTDDDDVNIFLANLIYVKFDKTNIVVRIDDETKHDLLLHYEMQIINPFISSLNDYIIIDHARTEEKEDKGDKK